MKKYTTDPEMNKLIDRMLRSGWVFESQNSHVKLQHVETGNLLVVSTSPSCRHASNQAFRDIRRMGLKLCP